MKQLYMIIISVFCSLGAVAQTTIWLEDFDGNSGAGSNWGILNENVGVQGPAENLWYISDTEDGNASGACGTGGGGDQSLHLGSSVAGDIGAAYEVGCSPGCFFCDFFGVCINSTTNKRTQSQDINTIGHNNLTLNFNYIEGGDLAIDDCMVEFSINGGVTWSTLVNTPKTDPAPCAPQGIWTAFSIALPLSCENIPNLRIAFRWINNADGVGVDPSFGVDDIRITKPILLPIKVVEFNGKRKNQLNWLTWTTSMELRSSHFTIERSVDAVLFKPLGDVSTKGEGSNKNTYSFEDKEPRIGGNYYRLKLVDINGAYSYSEVIYINFRATLPKELLIYPNPVSNHLAFSYFTEEDKVVKLSIVDLLGRTIQEKITSLEVGINQLELNINSCGSGTYLLKVFDGQLVSSQLFVKR